MYEQSEKRSFGSKVVGVVSTMARKLLAPRTQKFIEAGLVTECLTVTSRGIEAIHALAVEKWAEDLETVADEIIAEQNKK